MTSPEKKAGAADRRASEAYEAFRTFRVDDARLKRIVMLKLLSSPLVLYPSMGGFTALAAMWALGIRSGPAIFGAIAALLVSGGTFFTRIMLGNDQAIREALEEIKLESRQNLESALDHLKGRLLEDDDPLNDDCLQDLRQLIKAFTLDVGPGAKPVVRSFEIQARVEELIQYCLVSLESSLDLWYSAKDLRSPEAQRPILTKRKALVDEIARSIQKLGAILADTKTPAGSAGGQEGELSRLQSELDQSLEVARRIEKRMQDLDSDIRLSHDEDKRE